MEANELQSQIASKLANDVAFKTAVNLIIGSDINVIVGEDVGNEDPEKDYPCIVFSVKQQAPKGNILENSIRASVILRSEMQWTMVDGYKIYMDTILPEKICKEFFYVIKKLCGDDSTYFYEVPDQYLQDESVKGSVEVVTERVIKLKDKEW